ncbi:gliding motility-associated C-terminal domain-containing protein [Brumimicrobium mesophilum]|uniref:gliding motility-associated C-terminal domain-containing protein n=1 Tax=Brumimicrobium mesophilum TaxID=392717 RepID=UPI000D140571|nr:gliding motility-associated C-terminal domain-containing protein [Brumimicrobium mesophilum]
MMKHTFFFLLFFQSFFIFGQEAYNNCADAFELCPNSSFTLNNIDANSTVCANCEDDFNFCFAGENTIWMTFTTNDSGGDVDVNFSNIVFQNNPGQGNGLQAALISAPLPCISSSYNLISNCEANGTTNFALNSLSLPPNSTFYVVVNGTMGASLNAEATFDISISGTGVVRTPQIMIEADTNVICVGENVVFNATITDCDEQLVFNWYANGVLIGTTVDPNFESQQISNGDVITAEMVCFTQCQDTIASNSITFTVFDFPVDAGPDLYIKQGETIQLQGYTSELIFNWSPNYNMSKTTVLDPFVNPEVTTIYYLKASSSKCSKIDEMTVFVEEGLEIPNTFSPNADGINDFWEILGIEFFPNCNIQVYSRWGQLVFQTTGYSPNKFWDGNTQGGRNLAAGSYYYVIDLRDDNFDEPFKGTVTIVR